MLLRPFFHVILIWVRSSGLSFVYFFSRAMSYGKLGWMISYMYGWLDPYKSISFFFCFRWTDHCQCVRTAFRRGKENPRTPSNRWRHHLELLPPHLKVSMINMNPGLRDNTKNIFNVAWSRSLLYMPLSLSWLTWLLRYKISDGQNWNDDSYL